MEISLPCRLTSLRFGSQPLAGLTENISRGEILVQFPADQSFEDGPCVGDPVIVEIDLPANHSFGRKCMQCQTTVVRVSRSEEGPARLAMRIHKMRFQSCGEGHAGEDACGAPTRQLLM